MTLNFERPDLAEDRDKEQYPVVQSLAGSLS
jgi:hypothetical protein